MLGFTDDKNEQHDHCLHRKKEFIGILQDKIKGSKMKKNNAINLCQEVRLGRLLEKCTGGKMKVFKH